MSSLSHTHTSCHRVYHHLHHHGHRHRLAPPLAVAFSFRKLSTRKRTAPSSDAKPPHKFSYAAIRRATDSFSPSNRLGQSGFGSLQGEREFQNELLFAGKIDSDRILSVSLATTTLCEEFSVAPDNNQSPESFVTVGIAETSPETNPRSPRMAAVGDVSVSEGNIDTISLESGGGGGSVKKSGRKKSMSGKDWWWK